MNDGFFAHIIFLLQWLETATNKDSRLQRCVTQRVKSFCTTIGQKYLAVKEKNLERNVCLLYLESLTETSACKH